MKNKYIIIIFIVVILFLLSYLSIVGFQMVSTDKNIYSIGEEVKIHWSDSSLEWCTCNNKDVQIFKQEATGWERVQYYLLGFSGACVNGVVASVPMPCDVVSCSFPEPSFKSGDFSWNSKAYEFLGTVDSCLDSYSNEIVNVTMNSYELKNVTSGKYKITFGSAQEIIEIK